MRMNGVGTVIIVTAYIVMAYIGRLCLGSLGQKSDTWSPAKGKEKDDDGRHAIRLDGQAHRQARKRPWMWAVMCVCTRLLIQGHANVSTPAQHTDRKVTPGTEYT